MPDQMTDANRTDLVPSFPPAAAACQAGGCDCFLAGEPSVYALVPAAGQGTRMGAEINKPFLDLDGVPAIVRTLRTLSACPCVTGILILARAEEVPIMAALLAPEFSERLIGLAAGGSTRQESVAIGLAWLDRWLSHRPERAAATDGLDADLSNGLSGGLSAARTGSTAAADGLSAGDPLVAIHDGARCLVTREVICRTLRHAAAIAPCAAAVPVKDTIKAADASGRVERTLDRSRLYAIQTPQVARLSTYLAAFRQAAASGFAATDDLSVLEAAGIAVDLVPGDEHNIKLTTPWDLMLARALLAAGTQGIQGN